MELVFNLQEVEEVTEQQEGGFGLIDTGVYKNATIVRAVLGKTKKGNNKLDVTVKTEDGHELTIYQAYVLDTKWASGADNKYGYEAWLRFAKVTGIKSLATFQDSIKKSDGTQVMKDEQPLILTCLKDCHGAKCDVAIQKVFGYYNGEVTEKNEIYDVYACGSEKSDKVAERLKDKEDKDYKAYKAGGGSTEEEVNEEEEDLI